MSHLPHRYTDAITDRQGLKLAAHLKQGVGELDYDIRERLRAGRERALAQRKLEVVRHAPAWAQTGPAAALGWGGEEHLGLWGRLSAALTVGVLVLGLLAISDRISEDRARELADVDLALLTDDLPPAAFADPGFIQFLQKDL